VDVLIYERQRRATLLSQASEKLREGVAADLVLAADQFLIEPAGRIQERVRARALGNSIRAVIAGYHWFTDWGRDTMISLEGLALATGRHREARWILHTLSRYVRDGLLPNLFPEGADDGLYHTADATLWYFHGLDRYLDYTGDRATLRLLLPQLVDIAEHHVKGTRFGIGIDSADGLLRQGEQGYQLTWMDAKVDDWVVTPRRGKAVEINALWHNALRLLARWLNEERGPGSAGPWQDLADKQALSFNNRFWYDAGGYLFDIVDGEGGDDSSLRPNQILSFSLRYPVLDRARWQAVLSAVEEELLTPRGLRTLARSHPDYKASYSGDLRARDAAYHQGTVWPWLIGPFIDAWIACSPERRTQARKFLDGFKSHIEEGCIGSLSEICDSEPPYASRGCISQAWSVAEVLRCWLKTAE
jgi:predicted glycogen debranching enzyme